MSDSEAEHMAKRTLDSWSAYINLAITFMYMTNYYIVAPTSSES